MPLSRNYTVTLAGSMFHVIFTLQSTVVVGLLFTTVTDSQQQQWHPGPQKR